VLFSGVNDLTLPQVAEFGFLFKDVVLSSYVPATIKFTCVDTSINGITFSGGKILGHDSVSHISSYNIGEAFSVSGFKVKTATTDKWLWCVDGVVYDYLVAGTPNISGITVNVLDGTLSCDLVLNSNPFAYSLSAGDFGAGSGSIGRISSAVPCVTYGGTLEFYNSYQPLLTGNLGPVYSASGSPAPIYLYDIDTNQSNAPISFKATLDTTFDSVPQIITVNRTGLQAGSSLTFTPLSVDGGISGLFNGMASGTSFTFQDEIQSNLISVSVRKMNNMGTQSPSYVTIRASGITPTGTTSTYYVTGINMTSSGEYLYPPTLVSSGYYQVTGLEQAFSSMLFSSGCTGNLDITFSAVERISSASGYLGMRPVLFQNLYTAGTATYYIPESYNAYSSGDGYTSAPMSVVNTGKYSSCFDVPRYYANNKAWFTPFSGKGALKTLADGLTGEVVCVTGVVGASQTGYRVSGISLTNVGQGYNQTSYLPKVSFVRRAGDSLTKNATGVVLAVTGFNYSFANSWDFAYSIGNGEFQSIPYANPNYFSGVTMDANQNYLTIQSSYSGVPNTNPVSVMITIGTEDGSGYGFPITGTKYFSSDPLFLKKNFSVTGDYFSATPSSEPLSFTSTQTQLDTVYNSTAYTQNTWDVNLGDLDF
jgi:hypothetical protein